MSQPNATSYNCIKCKGMDDDHMVMCDKCDKWYHYGCVGVDNNVADYSWNCEFCDNSSSAAANPDQENGHETQPSSSSSPIASTCTSAQTVTVTAAGTISSSVKPQFTTASSVPLTATTTSSVPSTFQPPISATTTTTHSQLFAVPYQYTAPFTMGMQMFQPTSNPPSYGTAPSYMYAAQPTTTQIHYQQQPMQMNANNRNSTTGGKNNFNFLERQKMLQLERLEEERKIQQEFLDRKYKILEQNQSTAEQTNASYFSASNCQQNNTLPQVPAHSNTLNAESRFIGHQPEPTALQLAARRSIPRDLPPFSGDPEDWPIFINSFQNSTALAGYSDAENLMRLQSCLKGKARELVKSKLLLPALVPDIIRTLRLVFGRPEHILERVINKARNMPSPRDKLEALIEFALNVQNICATIESCGLDGHLNNPMLVKELLDKLPNQHKLNWAMMQKDESVPILKSFSVWLYSLAEAASTVVTPSFGKGASVNTHTQASSNVGRTCVVCKVESHKVYQCDKFKNLQLNEKWDIVKSNNLCRQCLSHHKRKCHLDKECGISGCKYKHHPLLHNSNRAVNPSTTQTVNPSTTPTANPSTMQTVSRNEIENTQRSAQINAHNNSDEEKPFFRILPIRLHSKNSVVNTFAFLDEGSSVTLVERSIFDSLHLNGVSDPLCLKWTGGTTREETESLRTSLEVSGVFNDTKFILSDVHTVKRLDLPSQTLNMADISTRYPYLKDLPIQSYHNAKPMILIGANNWKLAVPTRIREGNWQQPIATKTRLGWTLQGGSTKCSAGHRLNIHTCACQTNNDVLNELVKNYFNMESPNSSTLLSEADSNAMKTLNATCKKVDGRYETGLLWKNSDVQLPESYNNAYRRLMCLHKKIAKDKLLQQNMQNQINNLLEKGYARKLNSSELATPNDKVWYLPTFITLNPNKPNKMRLVWDAAARSNGASLNDFITSGPDLLKPLVDILLAFRIGKYAICGDIAEMFHRINVRESDMHAQRFLWWDKNDRIHQPSTYVMQALSFGVSCAPCIAHYVRDTNAAEFKKLFPSAVDSIKNHHYVDDLIDSEDTEEGAAVLAKQVAEVHAAAGFYIRNWASNSPMVLSQLSDVSKTSQDAKQWGATEKVLGMYWDPVTDVFKYNCRFARLRRNVIDEDLVPTKRECLQVLMSIFDPLGFLSCHTIGLKMLLQDVWRDCIGWDDPLNESLNAKWSHWKSCIPLIAAVEIPRCYSQLLHAAENVQLHTFVDAGEHAYSAVCYLVVQQGDCVTVTLVAAKCKVAPLKPLSIPRMELQAALIGVRLANTVQKIHRLRISSRYWWSDSKTVLQWLRLDPRNFQQFVMHRVGEILEHSNVNQWNWVPTKINPADFATKISTRKNMDLWFKGPEFLHKNSSEWPKCEDLGPMNSSEHRRHVLIIDRKLKNYNFINIEYFSNWKRLYRAVATFLLYMEKLKAATKQQGYHSTITHEMIQQAKLFIIKDAQRNEFYKEISDLKHGENVEKSSKLFRLNPYLDDNEVVRCRSRVNRLNNHENEIVLPAGHHVTLLIIRSFHEEFHHHFHEAVINKIKSQFYIPRLRVMYKKARNSCQVCKNYSAAPQAPQMAKLPSARLGAFQRPFTFVGIDFFGPMLVTVGRRREKRWGVVFTCLTIRAIHIEVAHNLDTSSCILCIRNFIARRGTPREIYTDNGTNFKAAEKVLKDQLDQIKFSNISIKFDKTKWYFNPPGAPHMGGAWERLIRSVKNVLYSLYPALNFNDESFKSALCEIESIINSRPLTFVSVEHEDDDAITPNHLLIGSCDGYKPFLDDGGNLRQRWQQTQEFADHFWHRWVKEYIPIICRRNKWFAKVPPVQIGAIAIIADENLPRRCWPKGKIINTVMAADGQVRRVTVKTQFGVLERPVTKIAVLDVGGDREQARFPDSLTGGRMLPPSTKG